MKILPNHRDSNWQSGMPRPRSLLFDYDHNLQLKDRNTIAAAAAKLLYLCEGDRTRAIAWVRKSEGRR